jgi:hypothetical protein
MAFSLKNVKGLQQYDFKQRLPLCLSNFDHMSEHFWADWQITSAYKGSAGKFEITGTGDLPDLSKRRNEMSCRGRKPLDH